MKNRYSLPLFLLSCLTFSSFASNTWKLQNVEYRVDTLSHIVIGPGTTQTILALEGPVKLRVFYTTTDMTNPNVNLKLIMGKDNLTSNVTVPNMPASHNDPENIYFAGVNADFIGGMGPVGTTVADGELYKSYKGTGWYAIGIDKDKKFCSGAPYTTFKLVSPNAGQASIKAVNAVRSDNELILFTSRKGSTTGTKGAGVELMIRTTNIATKDFTWSTEFNISTNKNKVLAMGPDKDFEYTFRPGLGTHPYSWLKVGQPVGVFYGYIMDGIYRSRAQIEAGNEPNASLGQKIYRDINGDGVVSIEDQTTIGDPNPDFFGGINNTFTYKNFTLSVFLQGTYGNDILAGGDFLYATVDPRFVNQYKRVKNFWSLDNPNGNYPKLYSNDEYQPSTYMIHDGSHLKIKSISLYYNFPVKSWKKNKTIQELQCYVTGTNLFTFTSYKGYDPEVNTGTEGGYKVYSANVLRGMDFTAYPSARTYTFGFKITL